MSAFVSGFHDHTSDLFHPFNDEHLCIPESIFRTISVFIQKLIILCIKGIYCIQKSDKMVVDASTPDKGILIGISFYFGAIQKVIPHLDIVLFHQELYHLIKNIFYDVLHLQTETVDRAEIRFVSPGNPHEVDIFTKGFAIMREEYVFWE